MENLINYCKPHESKPASEKLQEWRKNYYQNNKDKILERAREHSKAKYQDPEHREKVRIKNQNYRMIMKQAKELILKQSMEKEVKE